MVVSSSLPRCPDDALQGHRHRGKIFFCLISPPMFTYAIPFRLYITSIRITGEISKYSSQLIYDIYPRTPLPIILVLALFSKNGNARNIRTRLGARSRVSRLDPTGSSTLGEHIKLLIPPCSLLDSTTTLYNHVYTARGKTSLYPTY
jgi:hypothetical protein